SLRFNSPYRPDGPLQGSTHWTIWIPLNRAKREPLFLALLFIAASSSYPTRSSDRARIAATQFSTAFRTSPLTISCHRDRSQLASLRATVTGSARFGGRHF